MEITVSQEQARVPVTVMHINGSIDSSTYQQLRDRADELIKAGTTDLILDLKNVPYMSSAGLRTLNHLYKALHPGGGDTENVLGGVRSGTYHSPHLKLVSPSPRVLETLKMSGFDMFLDIKHSIKEALEAF